MDPPLLPSILTPTSHPPLTHPHHAPQLAGLREKRKRSRRSPVPPPPLEPCAAAPLPFGCLLPLLPLLPFMIVLPVALAPPTRC
mmetsp:Transcript_2203/g.4095  ORF Transcript_2203/g.4095 Transcript_2203/m.4095 type:complete len:84 (+) Transcript_2203:626-877(+)